MKFVNLLARPAFNAWNRDPAGSGKIGRWSHATKAAYSRCRSALSLRQDGRRTVPTGFSASEVERRAQELVRSWKDGRRPDRPLAGKRGSNAGGSRRQQGTRRLRL
ncbi:hypothetical protein ABID25_004073 [Mesorhizobium abyssinicae]